MLACYIYIYITSLNLTKENGFLLKKARSRHYLVETIMDADYADDIVLLANTPTQAEFLQNSMEQAALGISFQVNTNQTEYMYFK